MTLREPADVPLRLFGHIRMEHGSVRLEWDKQLKFCNYTNLAIAEACGRIQTSIMGRGSHYRKFESLH